MSATYLPPSSPSEHRLPTDVKPTHYDLTIRTDLQDLKFDGFVVVHLSVLKDTSTIAFNTSDLQLGDLTVTSPALQKPETYPSSALVVDESQERAALSLSSPLPAGSKVQLRVGFHGELTGAMAGYYRSSYQNNGKIEYYSLTQFEPTAARKGFPCWDEPLLKATFSVTLVSRENTVALSNMPAISEKAYDPASADGGGIVPWLSSKITAAGDKGSWKITTFDTTPPMSTYIVAYANGPFMYIEDSYKSPLSGKVRPLRVYATPDLIHQAQFALDVKRDVLPHYEKVFDVEYPLPKLDTLVVADFDSGAMENWGLITGRTSTFLLDPHKPDLRTKQNVARTQSHEVAHMWFGNITTMEWWDNLYLNEGFASLMGEVIILDKVFPEWRADAKFISDHLDIALELDAKLSSHPIEVDCPDANMINQIFDDLSYSKAASVLRMLSRYVGESKFLEGVSLYLKERRFSNSVTRDLWEGIEKATGAPIPKVMDNWVKTMGFPVVTVTETDNGISVRQDRFLETGPASPEHNETIWTIPLSVLTVSGNGEVKVDTTAVLDSREKTIPLDTSKPFKINAGTTGFYRVLYSQERLTKLAKEAAKEDSVISLEDRIGLVVDAPALAKAGYLEVSSTLTLIETLRNEKEYFVLASMADTIGILLSTWWEHKDIQDGLNKLRREIFVPIVNRLGYDYPEGEPVSQRQLRTRAICAAAPAGDESVVKELTSRFAKFIETSDDSCIPADLEGITYTIAVKYGGRKEYEAVRAIVDNPKTPSAGISAMVAMTATQDQALVDETFKYILTACRDQNLSYFFFGFPSNHKYAKYATQKFKEYYEILSGRLTGNFGFADLVQYSHEYLSTKKDYDETVAFFKTKDTSKYKLVLQQTLDNILTRTAWIERSTDDVRGWLQKRN